MQARESKFRGAVGMDLIFLAVRCLEGGRVLPRGPSECVPKAPGFKRGRAQIDQRFYLGLENSGNCIMRIQTGSNHLRQIGNEMSNEGPQSVGRYALQIGGVRLLPGEKVHEIVGESCGNRLNRHGLSFIREVKNLLL